MRTGHLSTKPTSLCQPLHGSSQHHPNIHISWPAGMIRKFRRLCSSKSLAKKAVDVFVRRMKIAGMTVHDVPHCHRAQVRCARVCRLVMPYTSQTGAAGIPGILSRSFASWFAEAPSWMSGSAPTHNRRRRQLRRWAYCPTAPPQYPHLMACWYDSEI